MTDITTYNKEKIHANKTRLPYLEGQNENII